MYSRPSVLLYSLFFLCIVCTEAAHVGKRHVPYRCISESICSHRYRPEASGESLTNYQEIYCDHGYSKCENGLCVKDLNDCFHRQQFTQRIQNSKMKVSCTINNIPRSGFIWIADVKKRLKLNDVVAEHTQLDYTCIENHYVIGNSTNFCYNGEWVNTVPECEPRCSPSKILSITFLASCYTKTNDQEREVRCTEPAVPGTIARINCKWGYQSFNAQIQTLICDQDGRWFPLPNQCTQICGEESPEGTAFIIGGEEADIKKVPWHVGIYMNRGTKPGHVICGGTIISPKVVISAAHCFWDKSKNKFNTVSEYRVVAGKYYRDLNDPREDNSYQILNIEKIHSVSGYNDYDGLFANDIAVVVLSNFVEFKANVGPACVEEYRFDDKVVQPGLIGRVAGWGLVESSGVPSETLKQIELPVIQREHCLKTFDQNFRPFFTSDKFCAGHLTGFGVCAGDSGGGLVFPKTVNGKTTYYLRGIVSTGQNKGGSCDNDIYSLFTNTAYYWDLMEHHIIANRPSIAVPSIPIKDNVAIKCDPIKGEKLILSKCFKHGLEMECGDAIDIGISITSMCERGHELRLAIAHTCQLNGIWWPPVVECSPVCGRTLSLPYIPWLVSIYAPKDGILPLIGSGVIVSERVVLSYAEKNYDLFTRDISALQIYGAVLHYFDNANTENQQFRSVSVTKRFLHKNPLDASDQTFAVLIIDRPFDFNMNYVAPVCLDFSTTANSKAVPYGDIGTTDAYGVKEGRILRNSYKILANSECKSTDANIITELSRGRMCAKRPDTINGNCAMVEGTGLVTSEVKNGINHSYLRGIAIKGSSKPQYNRCVEDKFQLFININDFKDHIQHYIMRFSDKSEEALWLSNKTCIVSSVPTNGIASMFETVNVELNVGSEIENLDIIEYSCKNGHRLVGSSINICMNGFWNKTVPNCDSTKSTVGAITKETTGKTTSETVTQTAIQTTYQTPTQTATETAPEIATEIVTEIVTETVTDTVATETISEAVSNTRSEIVRNCPAQLPPINGFAIQTETKNGKTYLIGCNTHFYLPPDYSTQSLCENGKWVPEIPKRCFAGKACHPITEKSLVLSQCSSKSLVKLCHQTKDIGSTLTTTCNEGYETRSPTAHTCAPNGEWWPPVVKCNAICGRTPSLPFVPWLISIYVPKDGILPLIGSGVLVSERVVLSYADENHDILTRDISALQVYAAVLHYYDNDNTENQQFRTVSNRFLHENPIDSTDRTFAVLIMNTPFDYNGNFVSPVCLDFSTNFNFNMFAFYGETGSVAAYGAKEGPILHNRYKVLDNFECKSNDENIDRELSRGKMCARTPETIEGNCAMVEGAGLVASKIELPLKDFAILRTTGALLTTSNYS